MAQKAIEEAVEAKDLNYIRGLLCSVLGSTDKDINSLFEEDYQYILNHGISEDELFQEDDGEEYSTEPSNENLDFLAGKFRVNFSKKKLESLKKMGRAIIEQEEKEAQKKTSKKQQETAIPQSSVASRNVVIPIASAAGALLGCGIAAAATTAAAVPIAVGGVAGAAIGAGAGVFFTKRKS